MHYLTTVLVNRNNINQLSENEVRSIAEIETEDYQDIAFDWRETETAGRWDDIYPSNVMYAENNLSQVIDTLKAIRNDRCEKLDKLLKKIEKSDFDLKKLIENYKTPQKNTYMEIYYLKSIVNILENSYNDITAFYNTEYGNALICDGIIENVKNNPQDYALVFFDCHI